ncbi:MAG: hypothetical protein JKX73_06340 [Flavobacteriales bacterium]|nr:hypothetical protein [Flavobacteriales bacterium]
MKFLLSSFTLILLIALNVRSYGQTQAEFDSLIALQEDTQDDTPKISLKHAELALKGGGL